MCVRRVCVCMCVCERLCVCVCERESMSLRVGMCAVGVLLFLCCVHELRMLWMFLCGRCVSGSRCVVDVAFMSCRCCGYFCVAVVFQGVDVLWMLCS